MQNIGGRDAGDYGGAAFLARFTKKYPGRTSIRFTACGTNQVALRAQRVDHYRS